ncbi:MAG: YtxH domain-containing protein [Chitinophagaceae bacterium]
MSTKNILIGAASGLAAGVLIGLLVAPAKGSETRQKIADSADQLRKKLRHLRGAASDELDELKSIFENEVDGLKDDVRERVLTLLKTAKASANNLKSEAISHS